MKIVLPPSGSEYLFFEATQWSLRKKINTVLLTLKMSMTLYQGSFSFFFFNDEGYTYIG